MNIALVPTNNLTVSSSIQISFPRSYWTNDISTQLLPINSSMSCIGLTSVINSLYRISITVSHASDLQIHSSLSPICLVLVEWLQLFRLESKTFCLHLPTNHPIPLLSHRLSVPIESIVVPFFRVD